MNSPAAYAWSTERGRAWALALDAFAAAGAVAVAATATCDLLTGTAQALAGNLAEWAIMDLAQPGPASRSVAGTRYQPGLSSALAGISAHDCPMIMSAMSQRTPLVQAATANPGELGTLPGGRSVVDALGARSYAVSPVVIDDVAIGAITIVRGGSQPHVTFLELSVLSHVADLAAEAARRLRRAERLPGSRRSRNQT